MKRYHIHYIGEPTRGGPWVANFDIYDLPANPLYHEIVQWCDERSLEIKTEAKFSKRFVVNCHVEFDAPNQAVEFKLRWWDGS